MSLLFVHSSPFPKYSGGIDTWLFHVIEKLDEAGKRIVVFAPASPDAPYYDIASFKNLTIVELPPIYVSQSLYKKLKRVIPGLSVVLVAFALLKWPFKSWRIIRRHITSEDTLIALHTVPTMLPVVLYKCLGGRRPVICSVRGSSGDLLRELNRRTLAWIYCKFERIIINFADLVITQGDDTKAYIRNELHADAIIVPNGVDVTRFAKRMPVQTDSGIDQLAALRAQNIPIILFLGTLRDVKGIPYLLKAAAYLRKELGKPFRICFVGKGDATAYRQVGEQYGIGENLLFLGEKKDVVPFVQISDVGVVVARSGGVQHSLLEMMAAGLPIVAWSIQTYLQVLSNGYSGHLVRDGDPVALAEGLAEVLQNPAYAAQLGRNAQQAVASHDWKVVAERLLTVVDAV